jgi:hypothetical protein
LVHAYACKQKQAKPSLSLEWLLSGPGEGRRLVILSYSTLQDRRVFVVGDRSKRMNVAFALVLSYKMACGMESCSGSAFIIFRHRAGPSPSCQVACTAQEKSSSEHAATLTPVACRFRGEEIAQGHRPPPSQSRLQQRPSPAWSQVRSKLFCRAGMG